jgi:hypothetical protein
VKVAATHRAVRTPKREAVTRPAARHTPPPARQREAQQPTYVSHAVTTVPARTVPTQVPVQTSPRPSTTSGAATPQSTGPAPLPAPPGGAHVKPLRAP